MSTDPHLPAAADPHPGQFMAGAQAAPPRTLIDILLSTASSHPEAPGIDDGQTQLTYTELLNHVRDRALELAESGIGPGDRVGIRIPSGTADLYVAILSTLMVGAAYVPVDVDDPEERARTVFGEANVAAVITAGFRISIHHDRPEHEFPQLRAPELSDDCWIIFTSGSTGTPKGVAVSHRSAAAFVDAEAQVFCADRPLGPSDRVLAGLSVAFDASCEEMWLAWRSGACLVPAPRALVKSGMDLGPWLAARDITVVSTVPTLAGLWPSHHLDRVRLLIVGGEACPPELVERLATPDRELWNTYGPTEATVVATAARLFPHEQVRIGLPLPGWELAIVDPQGIPVATGHTGELIIGGVGLARYLDPGKDAEKYAPMPTLGWDRAYRSGDLVVNDPVGLIFGGRADEQIKLGGRRIELGEIDAALLGLDGVLAAAAAVKKTVSGAEVLAGYVVPEDPSATRLDEWHARLRQELPAALVPRLACVPELPTKTSGKIDRNALPWPVAGHREGPAETLSDSAQWIGQQWEAVLGVAPSSTDDFFDSGGSSLGAAQLVSRLRERYAQVTVGDLYGHPKFGRLSEFLAKSVPQTTPLTPRKVVRTRKSMQWAQTLLAPFLHILSGARWVVYALLALKLGQSVGLDVPAPHWWHLAVLAVCVLNPVVRMLVSAACARALLGTLRPGTYPRSGGVHARLWLAEQISELSGAISMSSTPFVGWYARLLGNRVGARVDLHSIPPVTGMLSLGDGVAIEPEVDLKGWWIDGDLLHVGPIKVGDGVVIGARSTLMPGARVGRSARVEAGSAVLGKVRKQEVYSGSPAVRVCGVDEAVPAPPDKRARIPSILYFCGALYQSSLPLLALVPGVILLYLWVPLQVLAQPLAWLVIAPSLALAWFMALAVLIVVSVRLLSLGLRAGRYPVRSFMGSRVWAIERLMDMSRDLLFPLYAGLATPWWMRILGARVGKNVEISTALLVPSMTQIDDGAFLADDTMVASYELASGWMTIGPARVGKRAFLGNSGMAAPGRSVPKDALVAVLSATPEKAKKGSSWIGSPPVRLRRAAVDADSALTYAPSAGLRLRRALWETLRMSSIVALGLVVGGLIAALATVYALVTEPAGPLLALVVTLLLSGIAMLVVGFCVAFLAVLTKWVLVGRIRPGEHPLWSSFIWRNEVADCFVELLAAPFFARAAAGTPALVWWLRSLGAKIGHGVWCESYWLPEADLVTLADGTSVNRGCVVQTHLFHDRVMSLAEVRLDAGATLGPNSVILPAAQIGEAATVGAVSLIMRGESVPAHAFFTGNPVVPWNDAPGTR